MTEQSHQNKSLRNQPTSKEAGGAFDAASSSLFEALRVSFIILKVIMIVLVALFLASGFKTVGSDEQALVLRFGKIRGVGDHRIRGPGLHWVFPYPIDTIVKIPVEKRTNLPINSFWYFQRPEEMLPEGSKTQIRVPATLEPLRDGYCLTRSQKQEISGGDGSDYNIIHCKWQLAYKINDAERFFKNIHTDEVKPGQTYAEVIDSSIRPLLQNLFEDAVTAAIVNYTIDQALFLSQDRITSHIAKLLQERLDKIQSGITVVSVQLIDSTWPRQVNDAFLASLRASQESQKAISQAKGYAENTINEAAGPVAGELLAAIENKNLSENEQELLWSQLAGQGREKIAEATAYKTKTVESAKANAEYLQKILPEYRKRPKLVIHDIYQEAIKYVLNNVDEKIIIQPTGGIKGELRVLINRDPAIKPKSEKTEQK
ncbi:MAG: protease modulator HflK [Sedimentisphaerales bacterium]|nr:protease modulator HflK [Sedimentisphaerales bacterium]